MTKSRCVRRSASGWLGLWVTLALAGCTREQRDSTVEEVRTFLGLGAEVTEYSPFELHSDPSWEKKRWLYKTARLLRGGEGIRADEDISELVTKPREEIVKILLEDRRFADTALDFGLFFIGGKMERVRTEGGYLDAIFDFPQAVSAARAIVTGGEFLELLNYQQPMWHPPLDFGFEFRTEQYYDASAEKRRQIHFGQFLGQVERMIEVIEANPQMPLQEFCKNFDIFQALQRITNGQPFNLTNLFESTRRWYVPLEIACLTGVAPEGFDILAELKHIQAVDRQFIAELARFEPRVYGFQSLQDLKAFDVERLGIGLKPTAFSFPMRTKLTNSSTNYNRKRAAYILSRYFCDDLTPIGFVAPEEHTEGRHASEASCRSCHYKLDPMAGYFRNLGMNFRDFSEAKEIRFDDNAKLDREAYTKAWLAPAGSDRLWNVGFIRSAENESMNEYGESMEDLFETIRYAPEARRCLVKRMFEFFVGDNQAVDAGYLDYLTEEFSRIATVAPSSRAFMETVTKIVLSRAFAEPDPSPTQCYDFRPGADPSESRPCQIAFLVDKNCASCHSGQDASGRLDLSRYVVLEDGKPGFLHRDESGAQIPRQKTFESIVARLSTPDPELRMPYRREMPSAEREKLYLWANEVLKEIEKGNHP